MWGRSSWHYPKPTLRVRIGKFIQEIKRLLDDQGKNTKSREERRAEKRYDGRKRNDGKFFGGVTTPKAVKELKDVRKYKKK